NRVSYPLLVQTPNYTVDSMDALSTMPLTSKGEAGPGDRQLLMNVANVSRGRMPRVVSQLNIRSVVDVHADYQGGYVRCVATANSILVVTFANQRMELGDDALTAAIAAGYTRLRPVIMTAGAMVLGMIPMALGIGEGGEQNAPLGRAVIGGLLFATVATLVF